MSGGDRAKDLVVAALRPGSTVDFPQITEICERLESCPGEVPETVAAISIAIREGQAGKLRQALQALTIANEMTYNDRVVAALRREPGLREALGGLRLLRDSGLGGAVDENIRMLATEVERSCFVAVSQANSGPGLGQKGWRKQRDSALSQMSWTSLERKAATALQKADKWADKTAKNLETATMKAGNAIDRMANTVMQEAERTWTTMAGEQGETSSSPASHQAGRAVDASAAAPHGTSAPLASIVPRQDETRRRTTLPSGRHRDEMDDEDWQMRWAVNASLHDAQSSVTPAASSMGREPTELEAAQDREQAAVDAIANLRHRLRESNAIVDGLRGRLAEARSDLDLESERVAALESCRGIASDAADAMRNVCTRQGVQDVPPVHLKPPVVLGSAAYEAQLRERVAELEARLAAANASE